MAENKAVRKLAVPNPDYSGLVARQREFFLSGATRPVSWRKAQLEALKALFTENHDDLCDALRKDLREASLNGFSNPKTVQRNSRIGATAAIPISKHQSVKISYNNGAYINCGGNHQNTSLA